MNANHHQPVVVVQKETVFLNNVLEEAYQIRQQQREYNREIEARCNNLIDLVEEYRNRMAIQAIQNIEDNSGPLGPPQPEVRVSPEPIPVNVSAQVEDLPTVAPIPSTFDPFLYITATTSAQTAELSKQQQNYTQIKEENEEVRMPTELISVNVSENVEDIPTDNQIPLTLVPFMSTAATTSTKTVELSEQLQNDIQIKEEILEKEIRVPSAQGLIPANMEIEDFPTDTQIPSIFDASFSATTSTKTVEPSEKPQNDTQIKEEKDVSAETPLQNVPFPVQQTSSSSSISLPIINQTGISSPPNNISSFSETATTTVPNPIQNSMSAQIEYVEHQDSSSITITTITTTMPIPTAELTTEYNNGRSNAQNMLFQKQQERKQEEDNMKWDTFASCVIAKQQRKQRNSDEDDGGGQLLDYPKSFNIPNNFGSISSVLGSAPLMIQPEDNGPPPPPQPPTKRPRGRPKKYSSSIVFPTISTTNSMAKRENDNDQPNPSIEGGTPAKRGRGRPRKVIVPVSSDLSSI